MSQIIMGLLGKNGAGKGGIVNHVHLHRPDLSTAVFKPSDILLKTLDLWGIEATRENLQKLPIVMEEAFGNGILAQEVGRRISKSNAQVIFYDAVRLLSDVEVLRRFEHNVLVYVTADEKRRFERMNIRREKIGEGEMTYEQFAQQEVARTELYIDQISKGADEVIDNNGTEAELSDRIRALCDRYLPLTALT